VIARYLDGSWYQKVDDGITVLSLSRLSGARAVVAKH
jgi:hypothetical protein